jgi:hypothetical protein
VPEKSGWPRTKQKKMLPCKTLEQAPTYKKYSSTDTTLNTFHCFDPSFFKK